MWTSRHCRRSHCRCGLLNCADEPGCWELTEHKTQALRHYLLKGGFLLADNFTFFACTRTRWV